MNPKTTLLLPGRRRLDLSAGSVVMGILNVTPDSFSDGGDFLDPGAAIKRALEMVREGAGVIDVGPESTRPGSQPVPADAQIARAVPVIEGIRKTNDTVAISIDTRLAPVARAALEAGADIVNDISALRDDGVMVDVVASFSAPVVLMHMRGAPADMQRDGGPDYDDVISEIAAFLEERRRHAIAHGVDPSRIIFDPGIGFGKRREHNLLIMQNLDRFVSLGQPVLVGASRKSFLKDVLGRDKAPERDAGSLACATMAAMSGAAIVRTHAVRATVDALNTVAAVRQSCRAPTP